MTKFDFKSIISIKEAGFDGFASFKGILNPEQIPKSNGVYMILRPTTEKPVFLTIGTGGYHKGKDPNISIDELNNNWINDAIVIYIGKSTNIKRRIFEYKRFGSGENIGHYGGRYIWQIENALNDLIVCWKTTTNNDEIKIESDLISSFREQYGARPFANLIK